MRDTARRPLTARSVIASTLLGVDPPRLPALALVRSGELFGLREGATRTALSRMTAAGEVVAEDGSYTLAGRLLARHGRQQEARRPATPAGDAWDGTWILAIVTPDRRSAPDRAAFRSAARELLLAEVREGVWARPGGIDAVRSATAAGTVSDQSTWVHGARPDHVAPFVEAFDLPAWNDIANELISEMQRAQPSLDERSVDAVATTFVTSAAVLRHLLADPALPPELLPPDWAGDALRRAFDRFDSAFKATWREWYRKFRTV